MKRSMTITIKRSLKANNRLRKYLEDNMWFRRKIYNKCVELYREWEILDPETRGKFDKNLLYRKLREYVITEFDYSYYCTGIIDKCLKNFYDAIDKMWAARKKGVHAKLRFKTYDRYRSAFKVYNKQGFSKGNGITSAKCMILDDKHIQITFNKLFSKQILELKEPLKYTMKSGDRIIRNKFKNKRYSFRNEDIKEVVFVKEFNKYYINLVVEVEILEYDKPRELLAGIDLGIHNPIMVSHANENNKLISYDIPIPQNMLKRMNQLEKRIKRLQQIMSRKMLINRKRVDNGEIPSIYTNNYEKVRKKFRRAHTKLSNLKRDWRIKSVHFLVNHYDNLVVDEFTSPIKDNATIKVSSLNKISTELGMYYFMENLRWMASKYNCCRIDSPPDTTRTCSVCGHVNEHLKLGKRYLKCSKCGIKIDRDENASYNCYKYGKEFLLKA